MLSTQAMDGLGATSISNTVSVTHVAVEVGSLVARRSTNDACHTIGVEGEVVRDVVAEGCQCSPLDLRHCSTLNRGVGRCPRRGSISQVEQ